MKTFNLVLAVAAVLLYCVLPCLSETVNGDVDFSAEFSLGRSPRHSLGDDDSWKQPSTPMMLANKSHWRSELSGAYNDEPPAGTTRGWHPRRIELADLVPIATIQPGRLEIVSHAALLGARPVLAKMAPSPRDIPSLAREAAVYRRLHGLGVTPLFLGHVTVGDRIVGFVTEYVGEARAGAGDDDDGGGDDTLTEPNRSPPPRQPQPQPQPLPQNAPGKKAEACLAALRRMHARQVAHGDAHGENCLVRGDGSAVLIDFELALETPAQSELDRDLWIMTHTVGN